VLGWLFRLLDRGVRSPPPASSRAAAPPGRAPAPGPAAAPPADEAAPPGEDVDLADEPGFSPYSQALGLPAPLAPPPLDEEAELAELELCQRILEHCRRNKLGPTSAPTLSLQILNLVASPTAEVSEMARLISADPALSAGVLTVANSVLYRGLSEIETVRDAVTRLGLGEVGRVAGALSARSLFNPKLRLDLQAFGPRFAALYRRAIAIATGAAALAMRSGARSDRAYLGGMLHDVGRTVALRAVADLAREGKLALGPGDPRVERAVDRVHVEVGAELHQEWQMPQYLTVLAVRHHDPAIPADPEFRDLHVVRLAAAVHDLHRDPAVGWRAARELVQSAAVLRLDPNAVRALWSELRRAEEKVATAFGEGGPAQPA
jgi:putative nucleotidyltransferase with HDIG domain